MTRLREQVEDHYPGAVDCVVNNAAYVPPLHRWSLETDTPAISEVGAGQLLACLNLCAGRL